MSQTIQEIYDQASHRRREIETLNLMSAILLELKRINRKLDYVFPEESQESARETLQELKDRYESQACGAV